MSLNPGGKPTHPLPFSQTVTLLQRVRQEAQDEYGNDVYASVPVQIPYCVVQPASSSEIVQWTENVSTEITVFVPYGTQVSALDAFLIDGQKYEVQGIPSEWRSPFSGNTSPTQCRATLVTGAAV